MSARLLSHPMRPMACLSVFAALGLTAPALAVDNLLTNPGFLNTDGDTDPPTFGDGWGAFGAAGFNDFFNGNPHASLFPDTVGNSGGVFQLGIPGTAGSTYQFDLLDTRIESNFDADLVFGLEYWTADDETGIKLGETLTTIDAAERLALPNVDDGGSVNGSVFSVRGTAVPGTAVVRPIVSFDNVNPAYTFQSSANVFVFESFFSEIPAAGGELLKNPGFEDTNLDGNPGDNWGSFGSAGFNDFFSDPETPNAHASLFADTVGNSGGAFQSSQVGEAGVEYQFELTDVRIEENWDADLIFGLEYYDTDNFTKLGETLVTADTSVTGDGLSFDMTGTAVAGTAFVRPVVLFDNVNPAYTFQEQAGAFIFDASFSEAVAALLAGDYDGDGQVAQGDLNQVLNNWGGARTFEDGVTVFATANVDQEELNGVLNNWGATSAPSFAGFAVPEPGVAAVGLAAGLAALRRRRLDA
ncbi:MAG: hypothetical protein AAF663_10590 [Planctomycetota bacterium]